MRTIELFGNGTVFSAELFPPKRNGNLECVIRALKDMKTLAPDFVSITYGAGGDGAETTADVASIAKDAFDIETVAHMTCVNMNVEKLENQVAILKRKGIDNIMVLRGDITENSRFYDFKHASELAYYLKTHYPDFNLLGGCYPEKHPEAATLDEDVDNLKIKVSSGVSELITQLFFDNDAFFAFRDKVRAKGIFVPIEAGIMPITSHKMVERTIALSGAKIPQKLAQTLAIEDEDDFRRASMEYTHAQIEALLKEGIDGLHLYTMNNADVAKYFFDAFKDYRRCGL